MKNKATLILLLVLTAAIWGYVVMKVLNTTSDVTPLAAKKKTNAVAASNDTLESDHHLLLNYRDPFLRTTSVVKTSSKTLRPKKPVIEEKWPRLQYLGSIGSGKANKVAILTINNEEVLLQQGQVHEGVKLLKFYTDSVQVEFKKLKKNLKIQNH
jgi:hypothetical protein